MTTEEVVKFIRSHMIVEDFGFGFGLDKYLKGYVRGLITMASVQQIISLETVNQLNEELSLAILEAEEKRNKNTDQAPTI